MSTNEGRDFISKKDKEKLYTLILPELVQLVEIAKQIEEKVGKDESDVHTAAVTFAELCLLDSFSGILCGIVGWAESTGEEKRQKGLHAIIHTTSYANRVFVETNMHDLALGQLMESILQHASTERYEIFDTVETRRGLMK